MTRHANEALGYVEVAGTAVPRRTVPQCHCCSLPMRDQVDAWLLEGRSPWAIVQMLAPVEISKESIREHYARGHVPLPVKAAQARLSAVEPSPLVEALEAVVEPLAAHLGLLSAVVRDVAKRVGDGDLQPTVAEGLKAAEVLGRAEESKDRTFEWEEYEMAVNVLCDTARDVMSFEQWGEFQQAVGRSPVLKALIARQQARERAAALAS